MLWVITSCAPQSSELPTVKVLFIGNSFTDMNGGLDTFFKGLASNAQASRIAPGGFTLSSHATVESTLNTIRDGDWDYVVLQEQSQVPAQDLEYFYEGALSLNNVIKTTRAKTLLFMTWARPDSINRGVTTENLARAYNIVGDRLGVQVAPVGLAFATALEMRPQLGLNLSDGHPTPEGTYLAACVFYGAIFKQSPVGNPFSGGLSEDTRIFLQKVAAQQLGL